MRQTVIITLLFFIAACSTSTGLITTLEDAERGAKKYPEYTFAQLNEDKRLYEQYCSMCHQLKKPSAKKEGEWWLTVTTMALKAQNKAGKEVIDQKTQDAITRFLIVMCDATKRNH